MFALRPRIAVTLRLLLIAVISFNALVPNATLARSSDVQRTLANQNEAKQGQPEAVLRITNSHQPSFVRPVARTGRQSRADESVLAQTSGATIQCVSEYCSDQNPGVTLMEAFDSYTVDRLSFKINCTGTDCAKRNIYVSLLATVHFADPWGAGAPWDWWPSLYARALDANGFDTLGLNGDGTGAIHEIYCGKVRFGTCNLVAPGVISTEVMPGSPTLGAHFYVRVIPNSYGITGTWTRQQVTMLVSLNPFGDQIPFDSANCKSSCYYSQAQGWVADPINSNTGALSYSTKDLEIPTGAGPLTFERTYVSSLVNKFTAPLGYGWLHNQDLRLIFPGTNEPGLVSFKDASGNLYKFWYTKVPSTGTERFAPYAGYTASLTKNSGTPATYTLRDQSQNIYTFDATGKITSLVNASGQTITYTYNTGGQLDRVSADGGTHYLQFNYDTQARLQSVNDHTARSVNFGYDANGDLTSYTDALIQTWRYEYLSHRLTRVADPNNNTVQRNEYLPDGKASKQFDGESKPVTQLTYTPNNPIPAPVSSFDFETGTLTGWTVVSGDAFAPQDVTNVAACCGNHPAALNQQGIYHLWGSYSGGDAQLGVLRSNTVTLPANASVRILVAGSDSINNFYVALTRASDGAELFKATGEGREQYRQVVWNASAYAGQDVYIKAVDNGNGHINLDGVEFISMPSGPTTTLTTTSANALGGPTTHEYDAKGTLIRETNPLNAPTQKGYDNNFRPTSIQDALGNPPTTLGWSVDGANLESITDALNHETSISYNSLNRPTIVTDPSTNQTKYFYNDPNFPTLPTRIEYPLSFDGGVTYIGTDYAYYPPSSGISAGKVELITEAAGHKTHYTYTSAGLPDVVITAYQTPDAQTTDYDYDELGRLIKVTDPAGVITRHAYDPAGRMTVTIHNVDPSNPDVPTPIQNLISGSNIYNLYTRYYYDTRGNQIAVVDTYWTITRTYYDLVDRPVSVVQNLVINSTPANSEAQVLTAINTPLTGVPAYTSAQPDWNVRTDTVYDDAGNVLETRDPQGIITHNVYDQANRLTLSIQNYVGTGVYSPANPDQNIRTEYFYDLNDNLIATKDVLSTLTRTYFDELNRPKLTVQNWTGTNFLTDPPPSRAAGQCGSITNLCTENFYDDNGNLIATTDPKGIITRTYYDSLNRPVSVVQNLVGQAISNIAPPARAPNALTAAISTNVRTDTWYDKAGNVVATVDPRGVWTRTYYDQANRPVATLQNWTGSDLYGDLSTAPAYNPSNPYANVRTTIAYNSNGYRDTMTDPLGRVSKFEHDRLGQLLKMTANFANGGVPQNDQDQRNIVTAYVYDALGRQTRATDTLGRVTLSAYDDLSRLTSTTQNYLPGQGQNYKNATGDQFNLVTTYSYDARGNQIAVADTTGVVTRTYYDALARPVTLVRNLMGQDPFMPAPPARTNPPSSVTNLRTDTIYLGNDSVDAVIDEMGFRTDYDSDPLGRLLTIVDPLLKPTRFQYDANGNRTLTTDAETIATKYEYDGLNRLRAVIENYSNTQPPNHETNVRTEYTYDANGNRLSILDGNSHPTSFTYTVLGRLETEMDAIGNTMTYSYDALGNRRSLLDANGKTIGYDYDELNRLKLINYPAPDPDVTFDYDPLGRRQFMDDGVGRTAWVHNNLDLPRSITDPFASPISYDYDPLGNRTKLTYPDSSVVNYQYNPVNRLTTVTRGPSPLASYEYDALGRLKTVNRPNGIDTFYNYYDNGWLQDLTHSLGATTVASYEYQYDNVGNRTRAVENLFFPSPPPPTPTYTPTYTPVGPTATFTPSSTPTFTPTFTPTPTPPVGDLIFADSFESGDLSAWTSSVTGAGDLSVSTAAALAGSQGMQALIDDSTGLYVLDESPNAEPRYRARFYFDPNSLAMASTDAHFIFKGYSGTTTDILRVELRPAGAAYEIRAALRNDSTTWTNTAWFALSDASHSIELDWRAATGAGSNDGGLTFWLDGLQQANLTAIDNDTLRVEQARLGPLSALDTGTRGTVYFDAFESRRTTYIGPVGQGPTATPTFTPTNTPTLTVTNTPPGPTDTPSGPTDTPTATPATYIYSSQPDGANGVDTNIVSTSAATNFGTDVGLGVGESNNATNRIYRSLIKFDLSSIPANATITSATLSFWTANDFSDNDRTIRVYRLLTPFEESQATWNESAAGVSWQAAGASGASDRESMDIGSIQILATEALNMEKQIALTPAKIQELVGGAAANNGFIVIADTELNDRFQYKSSDTTTVSNRPKLVIQYTLPQGRAPTGKFAFTNYAASKARPQSVPITFTPAADAYIASGSPSTNYGSATTLQIDNSPIKHFLLKFVVTGLSGQTVTNAKIRLYNVDAASKGGDFYQVSDNSWQEGTLTWSNAPQAGTTLLASLNSVSVNTWYEVDVTSLITGEGTYSLRVSSTSSDGADYSSKEGANAPQLVIQTATPPTVTPIVTPPPPPPPQGPITIVYDYDPLYRLTAADYSPSGDYYHYTYDAVGNRKTQASMVGGVSTTDAYNYDAANRLSDLDGVLYDWDANGNLLRDGVNTYTYDSANRLKSMTGASPATFAYNGLGDRLSQNGVNYTLDLNAGLTQVLNDGTTTYLYGLGRVAQVNTGTEYFLGDALGSVRQLADTAGNSTLTRSYAPYGAVAYSLGSAQTSYGFTGEFTDPSGLVYLRARYYAPGMGRFLTRDTWAGNDNSPMSFNRWMYVKGNPTNLTDPSGHDWQYPTNWEGTEIHKMIESDFLAWGKNVAVERYIAQASKEDALRTQDQDIYLLTTNPDIIDPHDGKADLLDLSKPHVYEIKSYRSWKWGLAEAKWYRDHLNNDPRWNVYGQWNLGNRYLSKKKYMGLWPNDPNHEVWAERKTAGVIAYWGKERKSKSRQPSLEVDPQLAQYLAWLTAMGAAAAGLNNLKKGRQPGYGTYEFLYDPFNFCLFPLEEPEYPGGSPWNVQPLFPEPTFPEQEWWPPGDTGIDPRG